MDNTISKRCARGQAAREPDTILKVPEVPRDGGYSIGLLGGDTEPFPDFSLSPAFARDLCLHETSAIEKSWYKFAQSQVDIKDTTRCLDDAVHARTQAWLNQVTADQPFGEVLFFDVTSTIDDEGLQSLSFFSDATLATEKLVVASVVFCLSNGEFLYDREAIQEFLNHDKKGVMYWGPEFKSLPRAASLLDPFTSLPSYTSTENGQESCFSFEYEIEDASQAVLEAPGDYDDDEDEDEDEDDDTKSEASFICVTAAAHDKALAEEKTRPRAKQSDVLPFHRCCSLTPLKYVNKNKSPRPPIWIPSSPLHTIPIRIARGLKSVQRPAILKDNTTTLCAMRANMRDAPVIWPTYPKKFGDIQHLPAPRMPARPPRPGPCMLQPVHPEVKAQWETAKPLSLTFISKRPDSMPARHFPLERTPVSLNSLDLLRLHNTTGSSTIHSMEADLVSAPLRIDSKGIWPRPGAHTIRSVDPNIRAQWKALAKPELDGGLGERKTRTPLVLKPFKFLRKMLHAATRERGWGF
ncbi:hypothetical protein PSPO01_05075 [Paraphaeosphaeria sporulosa]